MKILEYALARKHKNLKYVNEIGEAVQKLEKLVQKYVAQNFEKHVANKNYHNTIMNATKKSVDEPKNEYNTVRKYVHDIRNGKIFNINTLELINKLPYEERIHILVAYNEMIDYYTTILDD